MKKTMLCALAALSLPQLLLAADHDHDHHKQKAHVHGVAELAMVLEGSKLEVEIKSPAESFIGFEHEAQTQAEKDIAHKAEASLKTPEVLFAFYGADCKLEDADVDMPGILGHEDHDHDEHHEDHDEHHDHDEDHEDHDEHHEGHSDITAHYTYSCSNPTGLTHLEVNLFKSFEHLKTINVMVVTDTNQKGETLTADHNVIHLR